MALLDAEVDSQEPRVTSAAGILHTKSGPAAPTCLQIADQEQTFSFFFIFIFSFPISLFHVFGKEETEGEEDDGDDPQMAR